MLLSAPIRRYRAPRRHPRLRPDVHCRSARALEDSADDDVQSDPIRDRRAAGGARRPRRPPRAHPVRGGLRQRRLAVRRTRRLPARDRRALARALRLAGTGGGDEPLRQLPRRPRRDPRPLRPRARSGSRTDAVDPDARLAVDVLGLRAPHRAALGPGPLRRRRGRRLRRDRPVPARHRVLEPAADPGHRDHRDRGSVGPVDARRPRLREVRGRRRRLRRVRQRPARARVRGPRDRRPPELSGHGDDGRARNDRPRRLLDGRAGMAHGPPARATGARPPTWPCTPKTLRRSRGR